jgi:hypothetical protein
MENIEISTSIIDIFKKQSEGFARILKEQSDSAVELMLNIEKEKNHYRNLYLSAIEKEKDDYRNLYLSTIEKEKVISIEEHSIPKIIPIKNLDESSSPYVLKHNEYLREKNSKIFVELIEEYPDNILKTLKDSITCLPVNIDELALKYKFVDDLNIIKNRINKFNKLKTEKSINVNDTYFDLCKKYQEAFKKNKSTLIKRYIKQIYIIYPDLFNEFLDIYKKYIPNNFNNILNEIKKNFEEEPDTLNKKEKYKRIDYKNISIKDLIEIAKNKVNKRGFIKQSLKLLHKKNRTIDDYNEFETLSNNIYIRPKKIVK